jgi:hypothetical protein
MKALFLLSFLELEPSKGFSFGLCNFSATILYSKAWTLLGFSPFQSLKGFLDLCDSYRVSTHMKVLSILIFSVAQNSKGINPFISLRWIFGDLLATTYSSNSFRSLQGIQQPCEGPPVTLLFYELRIELFCTHLHFLNALLEEIYKSYSGFVFSLNSRYSSPQCNLCTCSIPSW